MTIAKTVRPIATRTTARRAITFGMRCRTGDAGCWSKAANAQVKKHVQPKFGCFHHVLRPVKSQDWQLHLNHHADRSARGPDCAPTDDFAIGDYIGCLRQKHSLPSLQLRRKKSLDEGYGLVRVFFREEVATLHRLTLRLRSPLPPNSQRSSVFCIESVERTTLGPQVQHRAFNFSSRLLCRHVSCSTSMVAAARYSSQTPCTRAGSRYIETYSSRISDPKRSLAEGIMEDGLGRAKQITLWERLLLRQ